MSEIKRVVKAPRSKLCPICRTPYIRQRAIQPACSIPCLVELGLKKLAARKRKELLVGRKAAKTLREWLKDTQVAFNSFIRARDALKPCISSGRPLTGKFDAGHYRSVGAARQLRFHEDNCHGQTVHDNQHLSGNLIGYRRGLVERIGIDRVESLENNNVQIKWTIDDCKDLILFYKAKCKGLTIP